MQKQEEETLQEVQNSRMTNFSSSFLLMNAQRILILQSLGRNNSNHDKTTMLGGG